MTSDTSAWIFYISCIYTTQHSITLYIIGRVPTVFLSSFVKVSTLGVEWQALGLLWLRTNTALIRSTWTDLSLKGIHQLSIPDAWKEWMFAKAMKPNAPHPLEAFGKTFTKYLCSLPASTHAIGGTILDQPWFHSGRTGVIGIVFCLY
jgi:hypothetical protein